MKYFIVSYITVFIKITPMKLRSFWLNVVEEESPRLGQLIVWIGLYLLSFPYRVLVHFRNWGYRNRILKSQKLSVPVISVGNITVGGTGKTPVVHLLARYYQKLGKKVVILSRGYKRKNNHPIILVSDYTKVLVDWETAGDEPYQLAQSLPGVAVIVGNERKITGDYAIQELHPDLIILDDGFSHQQVSRNLNLVLINSTRPFGNDYYLPVGLLREPISSLHRADIILLTKTKPGKNYSDVISQIQKIKPSILIFTAKIVPVKLIEISNLIEHPISVLIREPIIAFAGIANPAPFKDILLELEAEVKSFITFPDHYIYSENEIQYLLEQAEQNQCKYLVTTQKDAVKLRNVLAKFLELQHRFLTLEIEYEIQNAAEFFSVLDSRLKP
jgi:tetraacyldisaccharide 4'-kinase